MKHNTPHNLDELLSADISQERPNASFKTQLINELEHSMNEKKSHPALRMFGGLLTGAALVAVVAFALNTPKGEQFARSTFSGTPHQEKHDIAAFESQEEFREYMVAAQNAGGPTLGGGRFALSAGVTEEAFELSAVADSAVPVGVLADGDNSASPSRVSETNIQVAGIDEPDIVKTDGEHLYIAGQEQYRFIDEPFFDIDIDTEFAPDYSTPTSATYITDAFPVDALAVSGEVDMTGDLLLNGDTLVVLSNDAATGYDVSNPADPEVLWNYGYGQNSYYNTARMYNGKLYVVANTYTYDGRCPVALLEGRTDVTVLCTDIYHSSTLVSNPETYTVLQIDPETGDVDNSYSFVGASGNTVVYMSEDHIYVTYAAYADGTELQFNFYLNEINDLLPSSVRDRLQQISNYDISISSKQNELYSALEDYYSSLDEQALAAYEAENGPVDDPYNWSEFGQFSEERIELETKISERLTSYIEERKRELSSTGIVRLDTDSLSNVTNNTVPGTLLNQFSLDEYNGNVRVATHHDGGFFGNVDSVNDVYVLNDSLNIVGQVLDLGEGERIYSVRFLGDEGYVVTFKQIDPFYVLDLSNPQNPTKEGELKIPGFSSYLHPLADNLILGVGEEDREVKLSLFDVSDPTNPQEVSKLLLDENWSDVSNTHHAFLQDADNELFFLPAGSKGYVISYADETLGELATITDVSARRAVYIDNNLYVVGNKKFVVYDEATWEKVGELRFED